MKTANKTLDLLVKNAREKRACHARSWTPWPRTSLRCVPLLTALLFTGIARADLVIEVGSGSEIGLSAIDVVAGELLTLDLYVTQVGSTTRLNDTATSLNAAEVEITVAGGQGLRFTNRSPGDFFTIENDLTEMSDQRLLLSVSTTKQASADLQGEFPGVLAIEDGVDDNSLRLGDFTLRTNADMLGTYMINLEGGTFLGASTTTTPDTGIAGVPLTSGSLMVNVTAVPEPASAMVVATIGVAWLWFRRGKATSLVNCGGDRLA